MKILFPETWLPNVNEYPSVIVIGFYQTLHGKYGSIKQTGKQNY